MATAEDSALSGTSCGTIACHAGVSSAPSTLTRKVNASSSAGVAACSVTSSANSAENTLVSISSARMRRRLSRMSASAPAGSANRNSGRLVATCTSDTTSGLGSRLVISQPEAALYIHEPTLETTVAIHRKRNTR